MPIVRLTTIERRSPLPVLNPTGGILAVRRAQLRCWMRLPNVSRLVDGIVDTGSPLTIVPEALWCRLREGIDFEWLPYAGGFQPPSGLLAGWRFSFQIARFLVPLTLIDYTTQIDRPGVVAQFTIGNPPVTPGPPYIILGLWGGVLEGGRVAIDRDPATGSVAGAVEFP